MSRHEKDNFDLYFYDGLANQKDLIRLTFQSKFEDHGRANYAGDNWNYLNDPIEVITTGIANYS